MSVGGYKIRNQSSVAEDLRTDGLIKTENL
jgi:hypothetical protein